MVYQQVRNAFFRVQDETNGALQSTKIRAELTEDPTKWRMKSKIGYAVFVSPELETSPRSHGRLLFQPYEIGGSPLADVRQVGDVAFYTGQSCLFVN